MTNGEKYLKDGADIDEFASELHYFWWANEYDVYESIRKFLHAKAKKQPTLTEDERVILRNIKKFNYIGREKDNDLYVRFRYCETYAEKYYIDMFRHLFQFIKEGEEYSIEELLK